MPIPSGPTTPDSPASPRTSRRRRSDFRADSSVGRAKATISRDDLIDMSELRGRIVA